MLSRTKKFESESLVSSIIWVLVNFPALQFDLASGDAAIMLPIFGLVTFAFMAAFAAMRARDTRLPKYRSRLEELRATRIPIHPVMVAVAFGLIYSAAITLGTAIGIGFRGMQLSHMGPAFYVYRGVFGFIMGAGLTGIDSWVHSKRLKESGLPLGRPVMVHHL